MEIDSLIPFLRSIIDTVHTFIPDLHWYFTCCTCETLQIWSTQLQVTDNIGFPWFGCMEKQGNSSGASQMDFKQHSKCRRNLHFLAYYKVMSPEFTEIILQCLEFFWKDGKKQMDLIWGWNFQKSIVVERDTESSSHRVLWEIFLLEELRSWFWVNIVSPGPNCVLFCKIMVHF